MPSGTRGFWIIISLSRIQFSLFSVGEVAHQSLHLAPDVVEQNLALHLKKFVNFQISQEEIAAVVEMSPNGRVLLDRCLQQYGLFWVKKLTDHGTCER